MAEHLVHHRLVAIPHDGVRPDHSLRVREHQVLSQDLGHLSDRLRALRRRRPGLLARVPLEQVLVTGTHRRVAGRQGHRLAFDHRLDRQELIVVVANSIDHRRDSERLVLQGMGQLVDEGDSRERASRNEEEALLIRIVEPRRLFHQHLDEKSLEIVAGLQEAEMDVGLPLLLDPLVRIVAFQLLQQEGAHLSLGHGGDRHRRLEGMPAHLGEDLPHVAHRIGDRRRDGGGPRQPPAPRGEQEEAGEDGGPSG